ncbi:MAG: tetratricopeptide repeat protein [Candidatus Coatesbacteria bacterium]|nr:tetratricopeptide repeat protein [Candidatus Coatesbacteria bacterium]
MAEANSMVIGSIGGVFGSLRSMVFSHRLAFFVLLLSIVVIPLLFDHEALDPYSAPKEAAVELLGLSLFVLFIFGLTGRDVARICFSPLGLPIGVYLGIGVVTLFYATNLWAGFDRLFLLLTAVFFYLAIPNLVNSKLALTRVVLVVLFTSFVVSLIGIMQFYHDAAPVAALNSLLDIIGLRRFEPGFDTYNRETYCSTFGHANFAGQYLVSVVPLVLSIAAWSLGRWRDKRLYPIIAVLCAFVSIVYLGITFCRGAWVGTIAAIAVMLFFSPHRKLFVTVAVIAIVLFAAASPLVKDDEGKSVAHKFKTIFDMKDSPTQFRFLVWKSSLRVVKEEPLGAGIGNFKVIYPKHRTVEERKNTGWDKVIYKAHNDYVQTFVELGVLGFAAFLWFIFIILKMGWRMTRRCKDGFLRAVSLGLLGGLAGTLTHCFFSSNFQLPASTHSFFVVLGLFAATFGLATGSLRPCLKTRIIDVFGKVVGKEGEGNEAQANASGLGLVRLLLIVILLMGSTIPLRALSANYNFGKGQLFESMAHDAENAEGWKLNIDKSLAHLRKAVWEAPRDYEIRYFSSIVENMAGNYDIAELDNAMAVKLAPYFDHVVNHYGNVLYNRKKFSEAMVQFKRALELNPVYADAMIRLGNVYREMGDYESALKQYDEAQKVTPKDAVPLFNKALIYQRIGEEIARSGSDPKRSKELLLMAKKVYDRCLEIDEDNIKVLNNLGTVLYSLGDLAEARKAFEKAISAIPEHISARLNLAALCEEAGDWDCAVEQYEALIEISGGQSERFLAGLDRAKTMLAKDIKK